MASVQHHGLHRLAHVDDDVGAAGEAVARRVEVEHQHVSHRHHGLRQVAGGGVEIEAPLRCYVLREWGGQAGQQGEGTQKVA